MKEEMRGSSSIERKYEIPQDTKKYASTGSYDLLVSKNEKQLMIKVTDYHPGLLSLTKQDLEAIINQMDD